MKNNSQAFQYPDATDFDYLASSHPEAKKRTSTGDRLDAPFGKGKEETVENLENLLKRLISNLCTTVDENKKLKEEIEELRKLSQTDVLTGLLNRAGYEERLNMEFARFQRYQDTFVMMIVDLDNFKEINDNYGHAAGDEILKGISNLLKNRLRTVDAVSRYGGDEFVIICPRTNMKEAEVVAEYLRKRIAEFSVEKDGQELKVTASFGFSQAYKGDNAETLFDRVDRALYSAKTNGRNTWNCSC